MGRIFFKNMQIGDGYDTTMLLGGIAQKTAKNGNPYVELSLSDGEENVIAGSLTARAGPWQTRV